MTTRTPNLADVRAAAERAHERVQRWPAWMRELSFWAAARRDRDEVEQWPDWNRDTALSPESRRTVRERRTTMTKNTLSDSMRVGHSRDWPAWLLALTPEQAHALPVLEAPALLYKDLGPGEWFKFKQLKSATPRMRTDDGHTWDGIHNEEAGNTHSEVERIGPVEVAQHILDRAGVAATVVEHEEPDGVHVEPTESGSYWVHGSVTLVQDKARKVMRQLAAALAGGER